MSRTTNAPTKIPAFTSVNAPGSKSWKMTEVNIAARGKASIARARSREDAISPSRITVATIHPGASLASSFSS
jgi:hypothetical protein